MEIRLLTFDCYGTIVDWERGLIAAFARHLCPDYYVGQLSEVVERWEAIQLALIREPYRRYRELLRESARRTVKELGLPRPEDDGFLAEAFGTFEPFPDSRDALRALSKIAPLWILSNIDNDILARTLETLSAPIARTITAEELRSYKPAPAHFEEALRLSGLDPSEILHVAFGFVYDIEPAARMGLRTAWINRAADARPEGARPDIEAPDLRTLAALLTT